MTPTRSGLEELVFESLKHLLGRANTPILRDEVTQILIELAPKIALLSFEYIEIKVTVKKEP